MYSIKRVWDQEGRRSDLINILQIVLVLTAVTHNVKIPNAAQPPSSGFRVPSDLRWLCREDTKEVGGQCNWHFTLIRQDVLAVIPAW